MSSHETLLREGVAFDQVIVALVERGLQANELMLVIDFAAL
jgi:hypothetical protein